MEKLLAYRIAGRASHIMNKDKTDGEKGMKEYYVYIMSNASKTLYTGVTNNLERRVAEHKAKTVPGLTERYNVTKLVYFEQCSLVYEAISREKQIKGWGRKKKIALIEEVNPEWKDLSENF